MTKKYLSLNSFLNAIKKSFILLVIFPLTLSCASKLKYEAKATKTVKNLEASISYPSIEHMIAP